MCKKRPYPSQAKARSAARRMRARFGRQWWYKCTDDDCDCWHLTSHPNARRVAGVVTVDHLILDHRKANTQ